MDSRIRRPGAGRLQIVGALALASLFLALPGCDDDGPTGPGDGDLTGAADLRRLAAVGNSLTMGITDGAVFESGQRCAPTALLAGQAGPVPFEMPIVSDPGIAGFPPGQGGRLEVRSLDPLVIERTASTGTPQNQDLDRPFNNLGVGGALMAEAMVAEDRSTSLTGNGLFELVFRQFGPWLDQLERLDATFTVVELGHNDVLTWAAAGGDPALVPGLPVPVEDFATVFQVFFPNAVAISDRLVVSNLADITVIPFFTTVPPVLADLSTGEIVTGPDGQPIPLLGPDGPLGPEDLVLLTAIELLQQGVGIPVEAGGTGQPLPDAVVLDAEEKTLARQTLAGYNQVIEAAAAEAGVPLWDLAGLLDRLAAGGVEAGGETLTGEFLTGGAFSLDGVHPTCKGYGVMANQLIELVNAEFGASIPTVDVSGLPGVPLPGGMAAGALRGEPGGGDGDRRARALPRFEPALEAEDFAPGGDFPVPTPSR